MSLKENIKYITQTGTASVFNIFVSIVRSKIIAIIIGTAGFGIIGQLNSLLNITHFLTGLGMEQGLVNEVAKARRSDDQRAYRNLCSSFFILTICMSFLLAVVVFVSAQSICLFLFDSLEYIWFVKLTAPVICTLGLHISYSTLLAANKQIKSMVKKSLAASFLSSFFTVVLVYQFNVDGIVYGLITNGIINIILGWYFVRKSKLDFFSRFGFNFSPHIPSVKRLLKYGSVLMYSSLLYQVVNLGIKSIIIKQTAIEEVGIYQAATNISKQYMPIFLVSLSTYLLPHIVSVDTLHERVKETNASLKALLLMATPVLFIIMCFSEVIVRLLYSPEFILSATLLSILVISDFIGLANKVASTFLISENKLMLIFILDTLVALTMYLFVYFMFDRLGLISAIYASVLASLFYFVSVAILLKAKCNFQFDIRNYVFILWIVINMAVTIIFFIDYSNWFKIGYIIVLFVLTYMILLNNYEKQELYKLLSFYLKRYGRKSS